MLRPGDIVARRYEVIELLAVGGMGAVYRARHRVSQREVALKIIHAHLTVDPQLEVRFFREARIAAEIDHPGLVEVLDAGTGDDGTLYLAMELLVGDNLRARIRRPGTTRGQALAWIDALLEPLGAAHAKGFVHRDLKPENVFVVLGSDGRETVKLLDFGIAKHLAQPGLTATGAALGTPRYMAPEQVLARDVGPASDVWSVGIMLYEIVAGAPPFSGPTPQAAYVRACTTPHVPLCEVVPNAGAGLSALIDRALDKDPARRPQDARSLSAQLHEALAAESESANEPIAMVSSPPPPLSPSPPLEVRVPKPTNESIARPEPKPIVATPSRPPVTSGFERTSRIVFGMVPQRDDDKARLLLSDLCTYLVQQTGISVIPHRAPTAEALASALRSGRVQVAWTGALLMLLSEHMTDMVPILSAVREGAGFYHSVLYALADSPVRDLVAAKGKRIAWVAASSAAGYVVPRLSLMRAGIPVKGYFAQEIFAGSHAHTARALAQGQVDLAGTYAIFEDGDPKKRIVRAGFLTFDPHMKVRILDVSGPIPSDLIVTTPQVPPDVRRSLAAAFQRISIDRASKEIMTDLIGADGFVPFTPAVLREVRALVDVARASGALVPR